jgi:hypothetical protein
MIAPEAGPSNARPAPYTSATRKMCHSSTAPVSASRARTPTAAPRATPAQNITQRRSMRSTTTPAKSRSAISGTVSATPTMASAVGVFQRS